MNAENRISPNKTLLERVFLKEPVERTPVWAMRQAGRWDPLFQKIRNNMDFYEFCENAELASQASLCPLRFGVDAIILFYDITTLSVAMGQEFDLVPKVGPVPRKPIRSMADVQQLDAKPNAERWSHVIELLLLTKRELAGSVPILIFAGAPFTLACYQLGFGKKIERVLQFAKEQPDAWFLLLDKIAEATEYFIKHLMSLGALAYQLFDSWAGSLPLDLYLEYANRYHKRIFQEISMNSILFVKDSPYVELDALAGCNGLSISKNNRIDEIKALNPDLIVQGNVDHKLLVSGSPQDVIQATNSCLSDGKGINHILNLDHGMDKMAKVDNFSAFVSCAKSQIS